MKTCSDDSCNNQQFGGDFCKFHQYKRRMYGGDKYVPKDRGTKSKDSKPSEALTLKSNTKIPKRSRRREIDEKYYTQNCKELEQELRDRDPQGKIYCFFSGNEITGRISFHHWYGRSGDWYTDKRGLVPVINEYHLMYHDLAVEKLEEQEWYSEFLERLKGFDISLWEKQTEKKMKSAKLNPRLFDEDF